jgi:osmotically-inducible protein OsmY
MNAVLGGRVEEQVRARVRVRTGRRVRELDVEVTDGAVVLRGACESFHVKQLALHAVREVLPAARVRNRIEVDG